MFFRNYTEFNKVFKTFEFCNEYNIRVQDFELSNDEITARMINNQESISRLIKSFYNNANETQQRKILNFLKHIIVDKKNFVLLSNENDVLRFIYYVNEFKDFQKISYKKDFLNFNPHNYFKSFRAQGSIAMLNLKNPELDKNHRFFIVEENLYKEFKEFTDKNYFFDLDINQSYIYSSQRRNTKQELQKTLLSDVLDFVKKYHTVGFDYDKAQENFEYHEYLIATYFEYYVHGPESLLDFLEHKIDIINDVSSNNIHCRHDSQYYLNLLK